MNRHVTLIAMISLLLVNSLVFAAIIQVPDMAPGIQAGIDMAVESDTVLVAPGTYFENINFNGKNIVVASHFIWDNDPNFIYSTIINGSQPTQPDTASCVLIISGEDSTAVLEGFTLTAGTGTKWRDEHGAGTYTEGGGILITLSSPTIRNNRIVNNEAIRMSSGTTSAGGGGIRIGDGSPLVENNYIANNKGMYGGGIVLNYASAKVRNNIIVNNEVFQAVTGVQTFGGGGIWIYQTGPNLIENNTIVGNSAFGSGSTFAAKGGGILTSTSTSTIRNNILWDNTQDIGGQLYVESTSSHPVSVTYNDVQGGFEGETNVDTDPLFFGNYLYLSANSPCIDVGDPESATDPDGTRVDMGAQYYDLNKPYISTVQFSINDSLENTNGRADAGETVSIIIGLKNVGADAQNVTATLMLDDADVTMEYNASSWGTVANGEAVSNKSNPIMLSVADGSVAHKVTCYIDITIDDQHYRNVMDSFELIVGTSSVMFVNDDAQHDYGKYYKNALAALDIIPLEWNVALQGCPSASLLPYDAEAVIWSAGDDRDSCLTSEEQQAIKSYLDRGGKLLITGQNIGYDFANDRTESDSLFYANVLHAEFVADSAGAVWAVGISGDAYANGIRVIFTGAYDGAGNQSTTDVINPIAPALPIFKYTPGANLVGGLRYSDKATDSKLIYLAFGIEGISGPKQDSATDLLQKALEWFQTPTATDRKSANTERPDSYKLYQNCPNPFNPTTLIHYDLAAANDVDLTIYDVVGREVTTLIHGYQQAGSHEIMFTADNLPSGVYIYKLQAGNFADYKKCVLLQ
ncbi:right-handed parallel beta-helix repeat-containing protein [candidate division KSB1 bacterium]|nr:right-handed parallel beta-helix repeat-containing protein [candidate division KSB1 bacterium]